MKKVLSFAVISVMLLTVCFPHSAMAYADEPIIDVQSKISKTDETMPIAIKDYLYENAVINQGERNMLVDVKKLIPTKIVALLPSTEENSLNLTDNNTNQEVANDIDLQELVLPETLLNANFSKGVDVRAYSWMNDGVLLDQINDNTTISYLYSNDGYIVKNISFKDSDGNSYYLLNRNNESFEESNLSEYQQKVSLTENEYNEFFEDLDNGLVEEQEIYSYDYVKSYLINKHMASEPITAMNTTSIIQTNDSAAVPIAIYDAIECTGINRVAYKTKISMYESNVKPVTANASNPIQIKYSYKNGLSQYYGSDTACIKIFDTRKHYVEYTQEFNIWEFMDNALTIYQVIKDTVNIKQDPASAILTYAGVIFDAMGNLTDNELKFMVRFDYKASFYRESQIYDRTQENDWVELPQLYEANVPIGMVNLGPDADGSYMYAWGFTPDPSFYPVGFDYQAYADYVTNIYYTNCVINGKWVHGKNAYGGLGGP